MVVGRAQGRGSTEGTAPLSATVGLDRAAARLSRFIQKRRLDLFRTTKGGAAQSQRVVIDGLSFDLDLRERNDAIIRLERALPGGRDRRLIMGALAPGTVVFDIGANVGHFTVAFARAVGETGRVYAFEPNPRMVARLSSHIALNRLQNVTVVSMALGDQSASMELSVPPGDDPGSGTLLADWRRDHQVETHRVPVERLDDYVRHNQIGRVDFIKLDVEGFEPRVLAGAEETIRRFRPRMLVEVFDLALRGGGSSADALLDLLQGLGYQLYKTLWWSDRLVRVVPGRRYGALFDVHCIPADEWDRGPPGTTPPSRNSEWRSGVAP